MKQIKDVFVQKVFEPDVIYVMQKILKIYLEVNFKMYYKKKEKLYDLKHKFLKL